jgi:hypothetical protein
VSRSPLRLTLLTCGLLALAACQGNCLGRAKPPNGGTAQSASSTDPTFSAEPVSYCRERSMAPPQATVQILVDGSGSMNGVTANVPDLVDWISHALSGLRGSSLEVASLRTCQFNQREGIFGCGSSAALQSYAPASETNLHQAIRAALDADLTFIVTDGVAATGSGGDADCASGVDAACVARALSDAVQPETGQDEGPGVWIFPLVTTYDGRLFTEEMISPNDFDPRATMDAIRDQLEKETVVRDPRLGSDGRLHFFYQGPRALLLIVIGRPANLGRDAVWSLWNQTSLQGVTRLESMKEFSSGIATLPPLEVYPGYLNQIRFESLKPTDEPSEHSGTMDVAFSASGSRPSVRIDCPPNGSGEGVYVLKGGRRERQHSATCVPIRQLPAYSLLLEPSRERADAGDLGTLIRSYQAQESEEILRLDLTCGASPRRPCESHPIPVRWNALRDYGHTAAAIAAAETGGIALASIKEASTLQPSREPHRVFGLAPVLQSFYELVEPDARRLPLADLEFCNGSVR